MFIVLKEHLNEDTKRVLYVHYVGPFEKYEDAQIYISSLEYNPWIIYKIEELLGQ